MPESLQTESEKSTGQAMSQLRSSSIDLIARSIASVLAAIYGLGFVILGFHDATYGLAQFSPFRTRIVLVGLVFTALVIIAAASHHYGFQYLAALASVVSDTSAERRSHRDIVLTAGFIYSAGSIAMFLTFFLFQLPVENRHAQVWQSIAIGVAVLVGFGIFVVVGKIFLERPLLAVFLSILAFLFILGGFLAPPLSKPTGYLTAMFCCIALYVTIVKRARSPLRFAFDYRSWYLAAAVLWIYITQIFGNLPPKWGGGKPTPILIFQHSPAPGSPSNPTDALLLDETDQGFYVLLSPTGRAFFIPRSNVASVFFGSKDDLVRKSP